MAESSKVRDEQVVSSKSSEPAGAEPSNCNTASSEDDFSATANQIGTFPETSEVILERLARQVEYYFSTTNLAKDTYVSTLRQLNDGYVPISIIANFGKVQALVPYDAVNAVRRAATEVSDLLEVVQIDKQTGKRVSADTIESDAVQTTVEAVGPISGEPIPLSKIPAAPMAPPAVKSGSSVQNTVIIREVPEGTEESNIRDLFTFERCPEIQGLHLDVANCWFVTLDTTSRDDMVHVMFQLRTMRFSCGDPVKARLKSAVVANADSPVIFRPIHTDINQMYPHMSLSPSRSTSSGSRKNKKKKNSNSRAKTNGNQSPNKGNSNGKVATPVKNGNRRHSAGKQKKNSGAGIKQEGRSSINGSKQKAPEDVPPPPALGEEQFPALPTEELGNTNKIEVEKVPDHRPEDDCEKNRTGSDSASTATTSSSSSSSKQASTHLPFGGYAAALLKAAPPKPQMKEKENKANNVDKALNQKTNNVVKTKDSNRPNEEGPVKLAPPVTVEPPSWGGGRSFADVLRK